MSAQLNRGARPNLRRWLLVFGAATMTAMPMMAQSGGGAPPPVAEVLGRVRQHDFHPTGGGFTSDRLLGKHGVASLDDTDWKVRTLAVRDLVKAGNVAAPALIEALGDSNAHVRYLAVMALGIQRAEAAVPALEMALRQDKDSTVRSQAAIALGQIAKPSSLAAVQAAQKDDKDRDVQHQAEIAAYAIEHAKPATPELAKAFAALDEATFGQAKVGEAAPDFTLPDTDGKTWKLSDFRGKKHVVLVWIFADWCPVCHGEFRELMALRKEFEAADVQPFTLECHDTFPARVMVGKELEPRYWFAKESFKENYTRNVWWPHLVDRAAAVGLRYDVQPMAFAVHAEYINRPTVAIVDKDGVVRFLYQGTFWGDRPSIHQLLEMVKSGAYEFAAPKRLKTKAPAPK